MTYEFMLEINYSHGGRHYGAVRSGIRKAALKLLDITGCEVLDVTQWGNPVKFMTIDGTAVFKADEPVMDAIKTILESLFGVDNVKVFVHAEDDDDE